MAIPYQVQGLTAQQADGNILLTWQPVFPVDGDVLTYEVQRKQNTEQNNVYQTIAEDLENTQYMDSNPGVGIKFTYRVRAVTVPD